MTYLDEVPKFILFYFSWLFIQFIYLRPIVLCCNSPTNSLRALISILIILNECVFACVCVCVCVCVSMFTSLVHMSSSNCSSYMEGVNLHLTVQLMGANNCLRNVTMFPAICVSKKKKKEKKCNGSSRYSNGDLLAKLCGPNFLGHHTVQKPIGEYSYFQLI